MYKYLDIEKRDNMAWVRMNRPPNNSLNIAFMEELIAVHREFEADNSIRGILLGSALPRFFCNGLDPQALLEEDLEGRLEIFRKLGELMHVIYSFPDLQMAVIAGHAMAGGAVLAILADFRYMAKEQGRIGFTEVAVGLTIPMGLLKLIRSVVGQANLPRVALLGTTFRAAEAHQLGLVDAFYPKDRLEKEAESLLRRSAALPQSSLRDVKKSIRREQLAAMEEESFASDKNMRHFLLGDGEEGLRAVLEGRRPNFQK